MTGSTIHCKGLLSGPLDNEQNDVIFCRNVLIYFDQPTKQKMIERLTRKPGGYLFTGRSESIHALSHTLVSVEPSIYHKREV